MNAVSFFAKNCCTTIVWLGALLGYRIHPLCNISGLFLFSELPMLIHIGYQLHSDLTDGHLPVSTISFMLETVSQFTKFEGLLLQGSSFSDSFPLLRQLHQSHTAVFQERYPHNQFATPAMFPQHSCPAWTHLHSSSSSTQLKVSNMQPLSMHLDRGHRQHIPQLVCHIITHVNISPRFWELFNATYILQALNCIKYMENPM